MYAVSLYLLCFTSSKNCWKQTAIVFVLEFILYIVEYKEASKKEPQCEAARGSTSHTRWIKKSWLTDNTSHLYDKGHQL